MNTYATFRPTAFDPAGLALDDRQDWLVAPCGRTRDSGPLELSNFDAALKAMGGEGDDVEVHRFGHWGPGWFEIVIVRPDSHAATVAQDMETALENYPVLDDEDFSRREWEDYESGWNDYGAKDFTRKLAKDFGLSDTVRYFLDDCDREALRAFFESGVRSGEYYVGESSGVSVNLRSFDCDRDQLAAFIRSQRATQAS